MPCVKTGQEKYLTHENVSILVNINKRARMLGWKDFAMASRYSHARPTNQAVYCYHFNQITCYTKDYRGLASIFFGGCNACFGKQFQIDL